MQITTLCIVAGSIACQARCPFCVARMTPLNGMTAKEPEVNWRNFNKAARLAQLANTTTVLITSKGEPTLFPDQITRFLAELEPYNFPIIEMQTNGITIADGKVTEDHLQKWYDLGLTTIAISIVHYDPAKNHEIYLPYRKPKASATAAEATTSCLTSDVTVAPVAADNAATSPAQVAALEAPQAILSDAAKVIPMSLGARLTVRAAQGEDEGYINLPKLFELLRKPERRFSIRLVCIGADGYIDSAQELKNLLTFAKQNGIEQVSLIPVNKPFDSSDAEAAEWVRKHHLKDNQRCDIERFLQKHGQKVRDLPHGATVYDVFGQNLNWSNCLTKDTDSNAIRSLIFFPDGHARTNWDLAGSILF